MTDAGFDITEYTTFLDHNVDLLNWYVVYMLRELLNSSIGSDNLYLITEHSLNEKSRIFKKLKKKTLRYTERREVGKENVVEEEIDETDEIVMAAVAVAEHEDNNNMNGGASISMKDNDFIIEVKNRITKKLKNDCTVKLVSSVSPLDNDPADCTNLSTNEETIVTQILDEIKDSTIKINIRIKQKNPKPRCILDIDNLPLKFKGLLKYFKIDDFFKKIAKRCVDDIIKSPIRLEYICSDNDIDIATIAAIAVDDFEEY